MLVRNWMSPDPVTNSGDTTVHEARRLLDYYGIRHLLVVDADRLVGVVSDRDVRDDRLPARFTVAQPDGGRHMEARLMQPIGPPPYPFRGHRRS